MKSSILEERICSEHPESNIAIACFHQGCQVNRLFCVGCLSKHIEHKDQLLDLNKTIAKIKEMITICNQKLNRYNNKIRDIGCCFKEIRKIIQSKQEQFQSQLDQQINDFVGNKCRLHQKQFEFICTNKTCKLQKFLCNQCKNNHNDHLQDIQIQDILKKMNDNYTKRYNGLLFIFDKLSNQLNQLPYQFQQKYFITADQFLLLDNKSFSKKVSQLQQIIFLKQEEDILQTLDFFVILKQNLKLSTFNNIEDNEKYASKNKIRQNILNEDQIYSQVKIDPQQNLPNQFNIHENYFDKILQIFKECFQKQSRKALTWKGDTLRILSFFNESLWWYNKILKKNPNCNEALFGKGESLRMSKDFELSIQCYDLALLNGFNYLPAINGKGKSLQETKQYGESLKCFQKAYSIDSKSQVALIGIGDCLRLLQRQQESIEFYDKAIEFDCSNIQALRGKVDCLKQLKRQDELQKTYDKIQDVNALIGKVDHLINFIISENKYSQLIEYYKQIINIDPKNCYQKNLYYKLQINY